MRQFSFAGIFLPHGGFAHRILLGGMVLGGLLAGGMMALPGAWAHEPTRQQQARACRGDALRLCATSIPDEARITACMQRKIDRLSPRCRAMFHPPGMPASPSGKVTRATPSVTPPPTPRATSSGDRRPV